MLSEGVPADARIALQSINAGSITTQIPPASWKES